MKTSIAYERVVQLARANIQTLRPYSSARHEYVGDAEVFLDANENPYDTGLNRYPDPLQQAVKNAIAALKGVVPERIFLGNGSDEAIDLIIRIFCEPGRDHIIVLPPTYGMYEVSAAIAGIAVRQIPLSGDFQPDVDAIIRAADAHSKALFLCSPNNPTGNSFHSEAVRALARGFPGMVVVDEAYIDFSGRESYAGLLDEFPNLIVMQTFSKAWGLAAIRLGMAFAGEPVIELFNRVKPPYNVNALTQHAALEAMRRPEAQARMVKDILEGRERLARALRAFSFVEKVYPSEANFLLVKVSDSNALYRYLVDQGIIVRNRSNAPLCAGCLRITAGEAGEIDRLLNALRAYETNGETRTSRGTPKY